MAIPENLSWKGAPVEKSAQYIEDEKKKQCNDLRSEAEISVGIIVLSLPEKNSPLGKLHGYVLDVVNTVFEVLSIKTSPYLTKRDNLKKNQLENIENVYKKIKVAQKTADEEDQKLLKEALTTLSTYAAKMSGHRVEKSLISEASSEIPNFTLGKKLMEEKLSERNTNFHSGHMMLLKTILSQDKYANSKNINTDELRAEIHEAILPSPEKIAERIKNLSKFELESYGSGRDFLDSIGGVTFSKAGYLTERDKLKLDKHNKINILLSDIRFGKNFGEKSKEKLENLVQFTKISKGDRVDRVLMQKEMKTDLRLGIVKKLVEKEFDHALTYENFLQIKQILSNPKYENQISEQELRRDLNTTEGMVDPFKGSHKPIQILNSVEDRILWKKST